METTVCLLVQAVAVVAAVATVVVIVLELVADVAAWVALVVVLEVLYLYLTNHGWNKRTKGRMAVGNGKEYYFHCHEGLPACL